MFEAVPVVSLDHERNLRGGLGVSHSLDLERFAVSQGKNGSKMYFCRAIDWAKDHWGSTVTKIKKKGYRQKSFAGHPIKLPKI